MEDMVEILTELQRCMLITTSNLLQFYTIMLSSPQCYRYVPTIATEEKVDVDEEVEPVTVQLHHFHNVLLGGDQLTCARVRGSQRIHENSTTGSARLEGLVPAIEDWHTGVCFMQVPNPIN